MKLPHYISDTCIRASLQGSTGSTRSFKKKLFGMLEWILEPKVHGP